MPLPSNFSVKTTQTVDVPIEDGVYEAVIEDIDALGEVETPWGKKDQMVFKFYVNGLQRSITHSINNSWSPGGRYQPSTLYVICKACGLAVTDDKPDASAINELIGQPIMLVIKNKDNEKGEKRSRVTEYLPVKKTPASLIDQTEIALKIKK